MRIEATNEISLSSCHKSIDLNRYTLLPVMMFCRPARILLLLCLSGIFQCKISFSQNLIPDPSFEDTSINVEENLQNWHKYFGHDTPDYFNLGNSHPHNDLFDRFMGGTLPRDGDGFMGIFCYRVCPSKNSRNVREFIESPLICKLVKDSVYSFRISLCLDAESNIIIRNFGVLFTEKPREIKSESKLFLTKPSISFDSIWLDDISGWMTMQKSYTASGNENYIVLGNFAPDNKTFTRPREVKYDAGRKEKWNLVKHESAAYYYIDDLVLEKTVALKAKHMKVPVENPSDEFELAKIKTDSAIILNNVNFEFNSTQFTQGSDHDLDRLLRFMQDNPAIRIKINGYTDNIGSKRYNLRLSWQRSEAVKEYLVDRGITSDRIECEGFGYDRPLQQNNSEENRQMNRRVEFIILSKRD
jgi:OOP family OmpA-OmpF porin